MGLVIRQSTYSTIFSYAGALIGAANTIWLFPKFMSLDEIGLYNVILNAAILMVPFAHLGLSQSIVRYFPKFKQTAKTRGHFWGFVTFFFLITFVFFAIVFQTFKPLVFKFFADNAPELETHSGLILTLIFLYAAGVVYESYSRALMKISIPFFIKELVLRVLKAVWVLFYALGYFDFETLLYTIIFNYTVALILIIVALFIQGDIRFSLEIGWVNKKFFRSFLNFSLFAMVGASGSAILFEIDSIMVTGMLGKTENGIYTTVFFMAVMIEIPRRAISQISGAMVAHAFQQERLDEIKTIYQKVSINQLIIGSFLFCLLWASIDHIFTFIPQGESFALGKWVVLIIGIGKLFDMTAGINGEIIIMSRFYRINIIILLIMAVTTISFNLLLIPKYGITGAALATAITLVVFNLCKFVFIWVKFGFHPFTLNTVRGLVPAIAAYLATLILPDLGHPIYNILFVSLVVTVLFILATILLKPSAEIDAIYKKYDNRIFRK